MIITTFMSVNFVNFMGAAAVLGATVVAAFFATALAFATGLLAWIHNAPREGNEGFPREVHEVHLGEAIGGGEHPRFCEHLLDDSVVT